MDKEKGRETQADSLFRRTHDTLAPLSSQFAAALDSKVQSKMKQKHQTINSVQKEKQNIAAPAHMESHRLQDQPEALLKETRDTLDLGSTHLVDNGKSYH